MQYKMVFTVACVVVLAAVAVYLFMNTDKLKMQYKMVFKVACVVVLAAVAVYFFMNTDKLTFKEVSPYEKYDVQLVVVACGDRLNETIVMIKSALTFSQKVLLIHVFTDDNLFLPFTEALESLPQQAQEKFDFRLHRVQFPENVDRNSWIELFQLCATQRIFLPSILTDVDAVLYVDTDSLFLRPIEDIWQHFHRFNRHQVVALAPEHEEPNNGWYNRFAMHPYYPPLGLNSGVMLMNLTRLRAAPWHEKMIEYFDTYRYNITWGDQDLLNIYFHFYPDTLYEYGCDWNFRQDHCMYSLVCRAAQENGVSVLHGSRRVYHNDEQPSFRAVYKAFEQYDLSGDVMNQLVTPMKKLLEESRHVDSSCSRQIPELLLLPERHAKQLAGGG